MNRLIAPVFEVSDSDYYCFGCQYPRRDETRAYIHGRPQKSCSLFQEPLFMDQDHDCEKLTACREALPVGVVKDTSHLGISGDNFD